MSYWGEFGGTNDLARVEAVKAWREAVVADGWTKDLKYKDTYERDGFKVMFVQREEKPDRARYRYDAIVYAWGPDRLAINVGLTYPGMAGLLELTRVCGTCSKNNVDTFQVAFANRCCETCAPELRKQLERPGWDR